MQGKTSDRKDLQSVVLLEALVDIEFQARIRQDPKQSWPNASVEPQEAF